MQHNQNSSIPYKDQIAANASLGNCLISVIRLPPTLQPIFVSKKLEQDLRPRDIKPPIVNQRCVVYLFSCDLCDAGYYVGYTARHLHHRISERKNSAIGKHFFLKHMETKIF